MLNEEEMNEVVNRLKKHPEILITSKKFHYGVKKGDAYVFYSMMLTKFWS